MASLGDNSHLTLVDPNNPANHRGKLVGHLGHPYTCPPENALQHLHPISSSDRLDCRNFHPPFQRSGHDPSKVDFWPRLVPHLADPGCHLMLHIYPPSLSHSSGPISFHK